jgi:hypothetical protein
MMDLNWYRMVMETIRALVAEEFPKTRPNGPDDELIANLMWHARENGATAETLREMLRNSEEGQNNQKADPEPEPDPVPILHGPVTVENARVFRDLDGEVSPIGCHFGEAFSAFLRRPTEVHDQLLAIRQAGYSFIRTWFNLGYYDSAWAGREVAFAPFRSRSGREIPMTELYYERVAEFSKLCESVGLRVLYSHGDMNSMRLDQIQLHFTRLRDVLMGLGANMVFGIELANEKWQNFPPDVAENENIAVDIMKTAFGGLNWVVLNSAPPPDVGEESRGFARMVNNWFPVANVHGTRNFRDPEFVLRRHFNYGYERFPEHYSGRPYAMISTEPGGPGQGVTVGNTDDVETLVGMHAATIIGGSATVYMSSHGVFWNGRIESQPGFKETGRLATDFFVPWVLRGNSYHGNRAEAWITSAGGFADTGAGFGRGDQILHGNRGWAIFHGGRGTRRLLFKQRMLAEVFSLSLVPLATITVSAGHVLQPGRDCLVRMTLR